MQPFNPNKTGGKEWCGQCEALNSAAAARACKSQFCKLKPLLPADQTIGFPIEPLLPADQTIGFPIEPKPIAAPVDVAPEIIERIQRARAETPPPKVPVMDPEPPKERGKSGPKTGPRPRDELGLTPPARHVLETMKKRAAPDGAVAVSFADIADDVGFSVATTVSPYVSVLIEKGLISILERKGGRSKTRYLIHGLTQEQPVVVPPGGPIDQRIIVDETPIERADMPEDPNKSPKEACGSCRFAHFAGIGNMRCRRLPPHAKAGHPVIKAGDWCGEFQRSA